MHDALGPCLAQARNLVQPDAHGGVSLPGPGAQLALPVAVADIHGQNAHAVAPRILGQLRRRVKTHRLGVEQRGQKGLGFVALEPRAGVGQQREARGMALGEPVLAKAFDLPEDGLRKLGRIPVRKQAADQLVAKFVDTALATPRGHGAPELVGLACGEAGRDHGDLHDLLLEDGHAQRAFEHLAHRLAGVGDGLQPLAPAQIGMHHAALDRPWTHDRYFDHQIIKLPGLQARQHGHLRARFDLEHPDGIGCANHVVCRRIVIRNILEPELRQPATPGHPGQRALDDGQHAEREDIDFEQAHRVEVVLVPLHDAASGHGCVLDRHQAREQPARQDEAAGVLRQVTRKPHQRLRELRPVPADRGFGIHASAGQPIHERLLAVPPLVGFGDLFDDVCIDAERTPGIAQHAARAVGNDHASECGTLPPIALVKVLDDFFTPVVLEIDVDVGRLIAFAADEALEQGIAIGRIDLGDTQAVADRRVGRRAAALAEDAALACEADQVVDGQEVRLVAQFVDEIELMQELPAHAVGNPLGVASGCALPGLLAQVTGRRMARRHDLVGVFVAQFIQAECAAIGDAHGLGEQRARIELRQAQARAKVLLCVGGQRVATLRDALAQANGGQDIVQRLARAPVHFDLADGRAGQVVARRSLQAALAQARLSGAVQTADADPGAQGEMACKPVCLGVDVFRAGAGIGYQDSQAPGDPGEVFGARKVLAFGRLHTGMRDALAEVAVAHAVLGDEHQAKRRTLCGAYSHFGPDQQRDALGARLRVSTHDAGH